MTPLLQVGAGTGGAWWWLIAVLLVGAAAGGYALFHRERRRRNGHHEDSYTAGLNLMLADRFTEAAKMLTAAAAADTGNIDAYLKLGSIYRRLGKPRRAAQIHMDLTARSGLPRHLAAELHRELARDFEQTGQLERAYRSLDKSRELDPGNPDDLDIRLRLLEREGRWKEAGKALSRRAAVSGDTDDARLALYRIQEAQALDDEERHHDARLLYKEALKTDPGAFEAMLYIAESYHREERSEDALEWVARFVREQPGSAQLALPMLQRLLFESGRYSEIEPILRQALANAPENSELVRPLVELLVKKGEYAEALELCEGALEGGDHGTELQLRKLQLLLMTGRDKEAEGWLEAMLERVKGAGREYYCRECGMKSERLLSRCPGCGNWRTFWGDRRR